VRPPRSRSLGPTPSLAGLILLVAGCAPAVRANLNVDTRLRFISSQATQASWSFRLDDHARDAELLVDGRPRIDGCSRAGHELRCELRGMFPGGHVVELRLPGALLRRSVLIGKPWPARPLLVRARTPEEVAQAADAGADGVVLDGRVVGSLVDLSDLADVAHAHGARAVVVGDVRAVELASADALLGERVPDEVLGRFPEARWLAVDDAATRALEAAAAGDAQALSRLGDARGLVEARGVVAATLALVSPAGAIVDRVAFPLLGARKRHAALRSGESAPATVEAGHFTVRLRSGRDEVLALANTSAEPWSFRSELSAPLDLLGGHLEAGALTVAPHDAALVVPSPAPDKTHF
jgi:hypothetical protein